VIFVFGLFSIGHLLRVPGEPNETQNYVRFEINLICENSAEQTSRDTLLARAGSVGHSLLGHPLHEVHVGQVYLRINRNLSKSEMNSCVAEGRITYKQFYIRREIVGRLMSAQ
jgi:hypothetical protein